MVAPASCVVVVLAGSVLLSAMLWIRSHISDPRMRSIIATAATGMFAALAIVQSTDLITNYHYLAERNLTTLALDYRPGS